MRVMSFCRLLGRTVRRYSTETPHQQAIRARGLPKKRAIPGVEKVVLVASGKGGVGKSTTSVNLALALSRTHPDASVGILDADVFGPSLPRMLNTVDRQPDVDASSRLLPLHAFGLKTLSMANLLPKDAPVVWRGLMVMQALNRLLFDVSWGPLDLLVVDMPPGTGDTQLSISQTVPLAGVVLVTTPQEVAIQDARKGADMFAKVEVPVLGVVHNMAGHVCVNCGHRQEVLGREGNVRRLAGELGVEVVGEVPLVGRLSEASDEGRPVVVTEPTSELAGIYVSMAEKVWEKLG